MSDTKQLSLTEILAKKHAKEAEDAAKKAKEEAEWQKQIEEASARERPNALVTMKEYIKIFGFTAAELGLKTKPQRGAGSGNTAGTRTVNHRIKSKDGSQTGSWNAHPAKFLEADGCFKSYAAGKSVDAWLVDPTKTEDKATFLAKLMKYHEEKEPTKEQLGKVTLEAVKAERSKLK